MPPAGQTIAAMPANQMAFTGNKVTGFKVMNIVTDFSHCTDKFVADMHGNRYGFLGPVIPVVDMNVGAADGGL